MDDHVLVPSKVFLTKGVGKNRHKLQSFEAALMDAGIEKYNLAYVSSILPPDCEIISREEGMGYLKPGQIVHCVMARNETNEPNRMIAAAIGIAQPKKTAQNADGSLYGYIAEHHGFGLTDEAASDYAEDLAATMLATTLGIPFDPNADWDEREQIYRASGRIFRPRSTAQSARADKDGNWTTVIAAAVFCKYGSD
jgi:arginine decarboxylase